MILKELLRLNLFKVLVTVFLEFLLYLVGILVFKNPIFFKTGCAPNLECPFCESCMMWRFPEIINFEVVLLTLLLFYLLSGLIYRAIFKSR